MEPVFVYAGKTYKTAGKAAVQAAKDLLAADDYVDRRSAASALSQVGHAAEEHVMALAKALQDAGAGVRYCAVVALAGLRPNALVGTTAAFGPLLQDRDPGIRYWAVRALNVLGGNATTHSTALLALLEDSDPHVRLASASALTSINPEVLPEAAHILVSCLQDRYGESFFRASAAEGLAALGPVSESHAPALSEALTDVHPTVRAAAAAALRSLGHTAVRNAATALAKVANSDEDHDARIAATLALRQLGFDEALSDADLGVRRWAVETLMDMGRAAGVHGQALAELLKDQDAHVRCMAAKTLGSIGSVVAQHAHDLSMALEDSDPKVRAVAAHALARVDSAAMPSAACVLAGFLKDDSPAVRESAADGLSAAKSAALPHAFALEEALADRDSGVRLAAIRALVAAGRRAVKPAGSIIANMANTDADGDVRRAAISALEKFELAARHTVKPQGTRKEENSSEDN